MNPYHPIPQTSSSISIKSPSLSENQETTTKSAPKTIPSSTSTSSSSASASNKRTCKNVIIHGFCKFQDRGCEFNHDIEKPKQQLAHHSTSPAETARNSPSVSAGSIHAPVFVPKSTFRHQQENVSPPRPILTNMYHHHLNHARLTSPIQPSPHHRFPFIHGQQQQYMYPPQLPSQQQQMPSHDSYFYMNNHPFPQPPQPQYHQYAPTLPHVANLQTHQRLVQSFYIPDNLREQLMKRNHATIATPAKETGLPEQIHVYHSLCRMEDTPGNVLGHSSWVYKAMCCTNGNYYTLVRIEGFRLVNEQAMHIVKQWRRIKHANIVSIREAFTTREFGDSSLVFVYDYHPCSMTLFEAYFSPQAQALLHARCQAAGGTINSMPVPETTLWSFITQLASALKAIHSAGLSARIMEPTNIIMTSKNRLRINCAGLVDVLQFDITTARQLQLQQQQRAMHQHEDLLGFGQLIVRLACCNTPTSSTPVAAASTMASFDYMSQFYSPNLKHIAYYLLGKPSLSKSIDEVIALIGPRVLHELNSSQYYTDTLEANLGQELENSRLVKLMSKLNVINERPEYEKDPRWQEAGGDRYKIKLFRDYIFHQVNEMGVPVVDMGHVIACINKLDAGADEHIMLTSRDNETSILVTYKELKSCIASAFNEINNTRTHSTTTTPHYTAVHKKR